MTDDFRNKFYSKYVSSFKKEEYEIDKSDIRKIFLEYRYRFRKLLNDISKDDSILEIGCGPGFILSFFKYLGYKNLEGVDISEEQVSIARSRGLDVHNIDIFKFLENIQPKYDVIIAFDFIEHFSKDEVLKLTSLIRRSLKKDGLLILRTPNGQGLFPGENIYGDLTHLTIFSSLSLQQLLKLNGFYDISFYETGPTPTSITSFIRFVLWKLIRLVLKCIRKIETNKRTDIWTENLICVCKKE